MMQNLAGGFPFTSTSEARGQGADTATEAALTTNLAQRATMALKAQLYYAIERIGQQRTELNQQFFRTPMAVDVIGLDNQHEQETILPELLRAADYLFDITPMNESLNRAERKAEANAALQTMLQAAPILIALSQAGAATPPNMDEFVKDWLDANDLLPTERFFSAKVPAGQQALPVANGGQPAGAPTMNGGGVTAPQSIDPAVSPSAQGSVSPATFMQRLAAQTGGVANT